MKLIVCDPIAPAAVKAIKKAGIKLDVQDDITPENLEAVIADYDAMVIRSRTKVRQPLIDKAENLKLIIRGGVGIDNIDVAYARSRGIEVRNTPAAASNPTAELLPKQRPFTRPASIFRISPRAIVATAASISAGISRA